MILAEYLNTLWVQQSLDSVNTEFNYLVSTTRNRYVELKEYFRKNYGLAVHGAEFESTDNGVKLCVIIYDRQVDINTLLAISSNITIGQRFVKDDSMTILDAFTCIFIDIDQNIEQL